MYQSPTLSLFIVTVFIFPITLLGGGGALLLKIFSTESEFLKKTNSVFVTGNTGTNIADLGILWILK